MSRSSALRLSSILVVAAVLLGSAACGYKRERQKRVLPEIPAPEAEGYLTEIDSDVRAAGQAASLAVGFEEVAAEPPFIANASGRHGGTLSISAVGQIQLFNPLTSSSATESEIQPLLFDGLVSYDNARWQHEPSLAHRWETSEDGLQWTFHLRRGVKWSDGEDFDAEDVLFTFKALFHEGIPSSTKEGFRVGDHPFPTVTAVDPYTVRFDLPEVNALFLVHLGSVMMVPEHRWNDTLEGDEPAFNQAMTASSDPSDIVGTGPYVLSDYKAGEAITFRRNPYAWRIDREGRRLPYTDRLIMLFFADISTRATAFLNGDFDLITDVPATSYDEFKVESDYGEFYFHRLRVSLNTAWITINQHPGSGEEGPFVAPHKLEWFQDKRFRRAISHAIDRKNLIKQVLNGKGEAIYGPTSPGNLTWFHETPITEYSPEKARALLAEMGFVDRDGDGILEDAQNRRLTLELTTNVENKIRVQCLDAIKVDLKDIGVEADTKPVNFNELVTQLQDGHRWELIFLGWGSGVPPDPLNGKNIHLTTGRLHAWYPQQPEPATEWEARGDAIIAEMDRLPDEADRKPLWNEYLELHAEHLPILYLYAANAYAASKPRVRNLEPSLLRPQTWHNADELWIEDGLIGGDR